MSNKNFEYKEKLLNTGIFKRVKEGQYKCKCCPFCNDSKFHMYVKISLTDDSPVVYKCFKCNISGKMNKQFMEYYNIDNISIPKTSYRKQINVGKVSSSVFTTVDANDQVSDVCEYINSRIGHYPTIYELQYFQYVGKPIMYAEQYLGGNNTGVFKNRYWFRMTNGNIIGRWINDNNKYRWIKYKTNRIDNHGLYSIKIPINLLQPINVCIAEGIMDVIGLFYNYKVDNAFYIASMGKDYSAGMKYLISLGIFGSGVNIKIFKDSNVKTKDIFINHNMRKLFGKVEIYENIVANDYGVMPDKLDIQKCMTLK